MLLQNIAQSIARITTQTVLMVLPIDERPEEEVTEMRLVKGEVVASYLDEPASRHAQVAEMVIEKAKTSAEHKKDVIILLSTPSPVWREPANNRMPASGKVLTGGVDANAPASGPKRFFGAARNVEEGEAWTIIATGANRYRFQDGRSLRRV